QTIISLPVHTDVWPVRALGALVVLVAVQPSVLGLYLPPVLIGLEQKGPVHPPQTIISLPVHTAVWESRPSGALVRLVGVHVSDGFGVGLGPSGTTKIGLLVPVMDGLLVSVAVIVWFPALPSRALKVPVPLVNVLSAGKWVPL